MADRSNGAKSKRLRARVSNGRKLIETLDGRGRLARRFRDVRAELEADIGRAPSAGEAIMIKQTAALVACSEVAQARILNGEVTAELLGELTKLSHVITRNLTKLGIKRKSSGAATLKEYLADKYGTKP